MKIFATADIHGNKALIYLIQETIRKEKVDILIIAGDIAPKGLYQLYQNGLKYDIRSAFCLRNSEIILDGNEQQIRAKLGLLGFVEISQDNHDFSLVKLKQKEALRRICELLKTLRIPVYLLIGNDDHISDNDWDKILSDYGIYNLNLRAYELEEFKMVGFQYILPTPWNTNNELSENSISDKLVSIESHMDRKTIFISHGPPKDILDRTANGLCVGSESIYKLVKEKQPMFHIFGHIHEAFGRTTIDKITFYNAASLWDNWFLRGYIIDTKTRSEKRVERKITLREFNVIYEEYLSTLQHEGRLGSLVVNNG